MEKYRKAVVAAVGAAALLLAGLGLEEYAGAEDEALVLVNAVIGLLTAVGVYKVPNDPKGPLA
jgi:hypothetical protein